LWLSHVPIPAANIHPMHGEETPAEEAAAKYELQLRRFFDINGDAIPTFDLILLGMGADGHTASIFPGTGAVSEESALVFAHYVVAKEMYRLTMTLPVLSDAREVIFLVSGTDKAEMLQAILESDDVKFPAQLVRPKNGTLRWIVDRAAASRLTVSTLQPDLRGGTSA
jgi:6-phosphogluconolactonase